MDSGFQHEALIYEDDATFLAAAMSFVEASQEAGDSTLVAVSDRNAGLLEGELDAMAADVRFAAIEDVGRNPARIIPLWHDFLDEQGGSSVRGLSEPVWPGRGAAEVDECERHESLLNLAFPREAPLSLLCLYDGSSLAEEVLNGVSRSHCVVTENGVPCGSHDYLAAGSSYAGDLDARPGDALAFEFDRSGLAEVRRLIERVATGAGFRRRATADLVVAASELAANSVAHGGGAGTLRTWRDGDRLVVELEDAGRIEEPLAGRLRPTVTQRGGRGLWLVNQLCDLVQIRSGELGTTVRLQAELD